MGTERDQTNFEQIDNDTTANGKTGNGWSAEAAALPRTAVLIDRRASRVEPVERILKQLQVTVVGKTGSRNHALQLVSELNSKVLIEVEEATPEHDSISWLRTAQERVPQLTAIAISTTDGSARVVPRPERTGHPEVVADTKRLDEVLDHSIYLASPGALAQRARTRTNGSAALTRRELEILRLVAEDVPACGRTGTTKRWLDVLAAGLLALLVAPLTVVLAVAIKLESPGPVFYRSRRIGYRGVEFDMLKFRKMKEEAGGPKLTLANDPRFTRLGRFLARAKLDELPQLWNIIRGEMSIVGPRPEDAGYVAYQASRYETILTVRPGLTGLSQLAFMRESSLFVGDSPETYYLDRLLPQKVGMDALYAERHTLLLDLRIVAWTVAAVLGIDVAVNRETGKLRRRRRVVSARATPLPQGEAALRLDDEAAQSERS